MKHQISPGRQLLTAIACISVVASLLFGCAIKDEIFLQNVDVKGPLSQPPVHITDADMKKKAFQVSPHISVNPQSLLTTSLDPKYYGPMPDTLVDFQWTGVQWSIPSMRFGLDIDYAVSNHLALMGGIAVSVGKAFHFTTGYGGIGLFWPDTGVSVRLDVGLQHNSMSYRGATVLVRKTETFFGSSSKETFYFLDQGSESHLNLFANLTWNSSNRNRFINYFLQLGISPQTLTNFIPGESIGPYSLFFPGITQHTVSDQRAGSSVLWLSAVPGVYFTLGESSRVVLGVRTLKEVLSESPQPGLLLIPMAQFDWRL